MTLANLYPDAIADAAVPIYTTAAVTKYVAATGDDVTGNGTSGLPYATVERALADIPRFIRHEVKILVEAGDYASGFPTEISNVTEEDGSLAIIGVGAPTVVSGPWTVTGIASLGAGGQRLTIGAGGLGAVDSLVGQMLMTLAGSGHPGNGHVVVANTDTTIDLIQTADMPHNADTFNLVNPAVKIALDQCQINVHNNRQTLTSPAWRIDANGIILHNIWFDLTASPIPYGAFILKGGIDTATGATMDFVRMDAPAGTYGVLGTADCSINSGFAYENSYIADGTTGIANLAVYGLPGLTVTGTAARDENLVRVDGWGSLTCVNVFGQINIANSDCVLSMCGMGKLNAPYGLSTMALGAIVIGVAGDPAVVVGRDSDLNDMYVEYGTYALEVFQNGRCYMTGMTCDSTNITLSAVLMGALAQLTIDGAHGAFLGATGAQAAAYFEGAAGGVQQAAWPNAGVLATDACGSNLIRIS